MYYSVLAGFFAALTAVIVKLSFADDVPKVSYRLLLFIRLSVLSV